MYRIACVVAVATALLISGRTQASEPIGGYLIVDKVVLEPSVSPTTIQIWGSITLATGKDNHSYSEPVRGYLYYKAPSGKEDVCRKEWSDLKKAAGTTQVIGFGEIYDDSYHLKNLGTVRKGNTKPEAPDNYPLGNGLVKWDQRGEDHGVISSGVISRLRSLPVPQTPGEGSLEPPGEITLVVRNMSDKKHPRAKYVFELESTSSGKEEATVEAGEKETRWTPQGKLKAGAKYTWRVRATEGEWKGPVATSSFVVKGEK